MSKRTVWVVIDEKGRTHPATDHMQADRFAKRYDKWYPEDAPHTVVKFVEASNGTKRR